jgi:(1->4)-alpha-D-glucan 1-alpha-D-glucosylmutase
VIGAFPVEGLKGEAARLAFLERMREHALKSAREAKVHTSWTLANKDYEDRLLAFVSRALASDTFLRAVTEFVQRIATFGATNSLAQLALRLASPGVPDIYQGCELWSFFLVDPDNRRPVDYEHRRSALADLEPRDATPTLAAELVDSFGDGRIKLHVTRTALRLRRSQSSLFLEGSYEPQQVEGPLSQHVVAFARRRGDSCLICVVPRLSSKLTQGRSPWPMGSVWGDASLHVSGFGKAFRNVFTGESLKGEALPLAKVFGAFPVAWLLGE